MYDATHIKVERFDVSATSPLPGQDLSAHKRWVALWGQLDLAQLPLFPTWEAEVHDALRTNLEQIEQIFAAYASGSADGAANELDMDEFHDFVVEAELATQAYSFGAISNQFTKSNGEDDNSLTLDEFLTMLVRISFFRANPHFGAHGSDGVREGAPPSELLPGCLVEMLEKLVLPNARRADVESRFREDVLALQEVQEVLSWRRTALLEWWEMCSGGKDLLELKQWIKALEKGYLLNDLVIAGHKCRLSEPRARAAFVQSVSTPEGLAPEEILECVARCGFYKYRCVTPMDAPAKIEGFVKNLLGDADEEQVIMSALTEGEGD